jgi:Fe-S-cluster containining protein
MTGHVKTADLPEEAQQFLLGVYERAKQRIEGLIRRHGMRPGLSAAMAKERIAILDHEMRPVFPALERVGTPVACAKGCGVCCTLTIDVTPDEAFALVDHLERNQPPETVAAIKARAAAADARGHGMEPLARHRLQIACPVQDPVTMECLGHAARPTPCQGYLSLDLKRCEAVHAGIGQDVPQPTAANMLTNVVSHTRSYALEDAGAPRQSLELTAALVAAWADPDAERRWLAGAAVLTDAASYQPKSEED